MPYLSATAVVIHYEEALYQVYAPLSNWEQRYLIPLCPGFPTINEKICGGVAATT